jgi:rhodanese-related sulfurtransferase
MGFFNRFKKKDERPAEPPRAQTPPPSQQPSQTDEIEEQPIPQVKEMPVEELKAKLDRGETPMIIDVREDWEYTLVHLPQAVHIPMNTIPQRMNQLDKNAEIVVQCHHGSRSWSVTAYLLQNGFTNVKNLTGGIDSWARRVDRTMRTY